MMSIELRRTYKEKTRPLNIGERFNSGHRDDNYHREFARDAQRVEQEMFYAEGKENTITCRPMLKRSHTVSGVRSLDRHKLDKILVATCEYYEDMKFDEQITKVKLLLKANADINTTQGVGLWKQPLIARMLYSKNEKLIEELIKLVDLSSLQPNVNYNESLLTSACGRTQYKIIDLLLKSKCEPNRIEKTGMTPLIYLCRFQYKDNDDERLRCLKLLVNFEGEDARTLKKRWIDTWSRLSPYDLDPIPWMIVANFCIPNINVLPKFTKLVGSETARACLSDYRNSQYFKEEALKLIGHHFRDARCQKENYWPSTKDAYVKMFKPSWG